MATVRFVLLLTLLHMSDGQRTLVDSRCVYTFNVPASDCSQTPDSNGEVEVVKSLAVGLQAQVTLLVSELRDLRAELATIKTTGGKHSLVCYLIYNLSRVHA